MKLTREAILGTYWSFSNVKNPVNVKPELLTVSHYQANSWRFPSPETQTIVKAIFSFYSEFYDCNKRVETFKDKKLSLFSGFRWIMNWENIFFSEWSFLQVSNECLEVKNLPKKVLHEKFVKQRGFWCLRLKSLSGLWGHFNIRFSFWDTL